MSKTVLRTCDLHKTYQEGSLSTTVLTGVDFELKAQEKLAIIGASGSGKSTLLHLLAGLDKPTKGEVVLMDEPLSSLSEVKRGKLRNRYVGFVYQFHFLLPELTALENVMVPLRIRRNGAAIAQQKAEYILEAVGLSHRLHHKPSELSGGERQRVAIARALITEPACILADEPTGNLDEKAAAEVFELMLALNERFNTALLIVTHDLRLAAKMDRQLLLTQGHLTEAPKPENPLL
jgi:lipoprotein-releasing system ATP-binding protein